jgi:hypothetical protein
MGAFHRAESSMRQGIPMMGVLVTTGLQDGIGQIVAPASPNRASEF